MNHLRAVGNAQRRGAGFTLIELVISSSLMAMILVSAYACLHAAIASQRLIEPRVDIIQSARVALALMSAELRSACPLSTNSEFLGMPRRLGDVQADNLDFATHYFTPRRPREADFCEVSFFLDRDPETGALSLWRRHNPTIAPDPLSGGRREELAKGVAGLKFEYYDGYDWYDSWGDVEGRGKPQTSLRSRGNLYGLPEAVRLTLWMEANPAAGRRGPDTAANPPPESPLVFQTVARLNLAAAGRARSAATSASGENDAMPSGPNPGGNQ